MTVTATFQFSEHPMLLSDMLLSGLEREGSNVALPVLGDIRNVFPNGSGWTITGIAQKIAILSDSCAVAWAGSQLGARIALSELADVVQRTSSDPEAIVGFFQNLPEDTLRLGTSLLGFAKSDKNFIRLQHEPDLETRMPDGTAVLLSGTGAAAVGRVVSSSGRARLRGTDPHPAAQAYELGLQIAGIHLRMENANDDQLLQFFGGFYEVAVYNGERFTKDSGVTYILWDGIEPSAKGFARPSHIVTSNNLNDVLLIKSQPLVWRNADRFEFGLVQLHVCSPVTRTVKVRPSPTPKHINHRTPWLVHCVLAMGKEGHIRRLAIVERPKYDGSDSVSLEVQDGAITRVNWKKQFWLDLQSAVESHLPGPPREAPFESE